MTSNALLGYLAQRAEGAREIAIHAGLLGDKRKTTGRFVHFPPDLIHTIRPERGHMIAFVRLQRAHTQTLFSHSPGFIVISAGESELDFL